jgi:dihydroorotate dehydrogenase
MIYQKILRPIFFLFSAEFIHKATFHIFHFFPFLGHLFGIPNKQIIRKYLKPVSAFGITFSHPVGIAAGLDKNARALPFFKHMGFAYVEVGTITPKPQKGNPKPRVFRLIRDGAMINRMGFNNQGLEVIRERLMKRPSGLIVGGNIGKNTLTPNDQAVNDFATCFEGLYSCVDYFVVNVSCPNIKDLSRLQNQEDLGKILGHLTGLRSQKDYYIPILLKISPDLSSGQLDEIVEVCKETGIDGLIATNTSIKRDNLTYSADEVTRFGDGGLSGTPIRQTSTDVIRYLRGKMGPGFPIIGSGGVMTPADAIEKLHAGADLVQIYTGFIYQGPGFVTDILKAYRKNG